MRIITISREFGSGGRELGKRLSDVLGFDYYDREIITAITERTGVDESSVEKELEMPVWRSVPLTFRASFSNSAIFQAPRIALLQAQRKVIEDIAETGRDAIIVGRNADVLLADYKPFRIFVCADIDSKIQRCIERSAEDESLTPKKIAENAWRIDKSRSDTHEMIADSKWGQCGAYELTVNTSGWDLKKLAPVIADFAVHWFER